MCKQSIDRIYHKHGKLSTNMCRNSRATRKLNNASTELEVWVGFFCALFRFTDLSYNNRSSLLNKTRACLSASFVEAGHTQRRCQQPVHDDVRVASDGRGEVCVERNVESVVPKVFLLLQCTATKVQGQLRTQTAQIIGFFFYMALSVLSYMSNVFRVD